MRKISVDEKLPNEAEIAAGQAVLSLEEQRQPVEIELTVEIGLEIAGEQISALTMSPPTGAMLAQVQAGSDTQRTIQSLAIACNVNAKVIENLHLRDFNRVSAVFIAFGA